MQNNLLRAHSSSLLSNVSCQQLPSSHPCLSPSLPSVSASRSQGLRLVQSSPHAVTFLVNSGQRFFTGTEPKNKHMEETRGGQHGYSRPAVPELGKQSFLQRLFGRKKKLEYSCIIQSELLERFKKFLVLAVDLAVFQGW